MEIVTKALIASALVTFLKAPLPVQGAITQDICNNESLLETTVGRDRLFVKERTIYDSALMNLGNAYKSSPHQGDAALEEIRDTYCIAVDAIMLAKLIEASK